MMSHRTPAVVVYRMKRLSYKIAKKLVTIPYITLVNLLANEEVYPEFPTYLDPSDKVAVRVLEILNDPDRARSIRRRLEALCQSVAKPGACAAAARIIVGMAKGPEASVNTARQTSASS
jgi:lipid-A-disaccharide synthase